MSGYIIRAIGFANGVPCPHAGQWLKSFDHDAFDGTGFGEFTPSPVRAMKFAVQVESWKFLWEKN